MKREHKDRTNKPSIEHRVSYCLLVSGGDWRVCCCMCTLECISGLCLKGVSLQRICWQKEFWYRLFWGCFSDRPLCFPLVLLPHCLPVFPFRQFCWCSALRLPHIRCCTRGAYRYHRNTATEAFTYTPHLKRSTVTFKTTYELSYRIKRKQFQHWQWHWGVTKEQENTVRTHGFSALTKPNIFSNFMPQQKRPPHTVRSKCKKLKYIPM